MNDSEFYPAPKPVPERPLIGQTVLVVEDSRAASEAMRLLCLRSGARIRRADSMQAARRHLQVYRPSAVIIDLGLPDGSGLDLIEELNMATPRIAVILGSSGDDGRREAAMAVGADGYLAKPIASLAAFQSMLLAHIPAEHQPRGPRSVPDLAVPTDPIAYCDDMAHAVDVLAETGEDGRGLDYLTQFVGGVAKSADDHDLAAAARRVQRARNKGLPHASDLARLAGLVQDRLEKRRAI